MDKINCLNGSVWGVWSHPQTPSSHKVSGLEMGLYGTINRMFVVVFYTSCIASFSNVAQTCRMFVCLGDPESEATSYIVHLEGSF